MNTVKAAQYIKDNYPDTEITVFYMDLRAFGKGFEELFMRSKSNGVRYIRGIPGDVREDAATGNLWVTVENTMANRLESHEVDMLVLSVGATPATDTETIRQMVSLSRAPSGFLKEAHPKLRPVDTPTKGIYIAGAAESPKDVRESVTQASAAASRAVDLAQQEQVRRGGHHRRGGRGPVQDVWPVRRRLPLWRHPMGEKVRGTRHQRRLHGLRHLCRRVQVLGHPDAPLLRPGHLCPARRHPG
jgi:heterodisulfide reductase subunit A-like polyferredoxin